MPVMLMMGRGREIHDQRCERRARFSKSLFKKRKKHDTQTENFLPNNLTVESLI